MPIHDWARVDADLFHHFHRCWTTAVCNDLNGGLLPPSFSALLERRTPVDSAHGLRGDRVVVRRRLTEAVCVIEVVSQADKRGQRAFEQLVGQAVRFLRNDVSLLMVDLFAPTIRDPRGLPGAIWAEVNESFNPAMDKRLTVASYMTGHPSGRSTPCLFLEPVEVGDLLPNMPAFLEPDAYVLVPLEPAYLRAWESCPPSMRELVERGRLADEGG